MPWWAWNSCNKQTHLTSGWVSAKPVLQSTCAVTSPSVSTSSSHVLTSACHTECHPAHQVGVRTREPLRHALRHQGHGEGCQYCLGRGDHAATTQSREALRRENDGNGNSGAITAPQGKDEPSSNYEKRRSLAIGTSPANHGSTERGATSQRQAVPGSQACGFCSMGKSPVAELGCKTAWFARSSATPDAHCIQVRLKADAAFRETPRQQTFSDTHLRARSSGSRPTSCSSRDRNFPRNLSTDKTLTKLSCRAKVSGNPGNSWETASSFQGLPRAAVNRPGKGSYFPKIASRKFCQNFALPVRQNLTTFSGNVCGGSFLAGEPSIFDSRVKNPSADRPDREVISPNSVPEKFAIVFPCKSQRKTTGKHRRTREFFPLMV